MFAGRTNLEEGNANQVVAIVCAIFALLASISASHGVMTGANADVFAACGRELSCCAHAAETVPPTSMCSYLRASADDGSRRRNCYR
jgi:hypothetical protein